MFMDDKLTGGGATCWSFEIPTFTGGTINNRQRKDLRLVFDSKNALVSTCRHI